MLQKTVGIVLHTLKYNDTSNIVDIYTRENGRASFLVSVPRSRKSAVKTVLFQPLSMISTSILRTFDETKAGSVGPRRIFLMPR